MDKTALEYLASQRVCVLSGILPDGASHSSTLHFSHVEEPLRLFFQTHNGTEKYRALTEGKNPAASVVLGFDENERKTLQMRGTKRIVTDADELAAIYEIHHAKNPHAEKMMGPHTVIIEFVPTWWRYSDLDANPKVVLSSES